jgi:methionyl-tRNA formyltransferase
MDGDETAGVTTMMMDEGIDTGDMLLKAETKILPAETCGELTQRLSRIGAELLTMTLDALEAGSLVRTPQNDSEMTYDPMLNKTMGCVDFNLDAQRVKGLVNGLNPWPCVSVPLEGNRLKLLRAETAEGNGIAGTVLKADPKSGLIIACGKGAIRILELQAPGGKRMRSEDFLRGHGIEEGTCFSECQIRKTI